MKNYNIEADMNAAYSHALCNAGIVVRNLLPAIEQPIVGSREEPRKMSHFLNNDSALRDALSEVTERYANSVHPLTAILETGPVSIDIIQTVLSTIENQLIPKLEKFDTRLTELLKAEGLHPKDRQRITKIREVLHGDTVHEKPGMYDALRYMLEVTPEQAYAREQWWHQMNAVFVEEAKEQDKVLNSEFNVYEANLTSPQKEAYKEAYTWIVHWAGNSWSFFASEIFSWQQPHKLMGLEIANPDVATQFLELVSNHYIPAIQTYRDVISGITPSQISPDQYVKQQRLVQDCDRLKSTVEAAVKAFNGEENVRETLRAFQAEHSPRR